MNTTGRLFAKSQVVDYELRGNTAEDMNVLEYFTNTYESSIKSRHADHASSSSSRGRHMHTRIPYHPTHPSHKSRVRILRPSTHTTLPNFIGSYFPRADDLDSHDFYCASMLLLFTPWRRLLVDLKDPFESWTDAFNRKLVQLPHLFHRMIDNIQFYYECERSVRDHREVDTSAVTTQETTADDTSECPPFMSSSVQDEEDAMFVEDTETSSLLPTREQLHGKHAIQLAVNANIFPPSQELSFPHIGNIHVASPTDFAHLQR